MSSVSAPEEHYYYQDQQMLEEELLDIEFESEAWVKDLRRWVAATLTVSREEDQAKIHIAMLRREFILAAREKEYYASLITPLERPRSRESRTFLKVLLSIVGLRAKQAQCVINGINQIGIVGYRYKRPTIDDYAAVANGTAHLAPTVRKIESAAAARLLSTKTNSHIKRTLQEISTGQEMNSINQLPPPLPQNNDQVLTTNSIEHSISEEEPAAKVPKITSSDDQAAQVSMPTPLNTPSQPSHTEAITTVADPSSAASKKDTNDTTTDDVQLHFAVRTFKLGARQQLATYNLSALRESSVPSEGIGFELSRITEGYRTDQTSICGFDAVALGLLCLGAEHPPLPSALRTLTVIDDIIRVSNPATDTRLPEYLDFDKALAVFDSQLIPLANKLSPVARWLAVEAHRDSQAYKTYKERGLPIIDASTGLPKAKINFDEWTPSAIYCTAFPRRHPDIIYLRAQLPYSIIPAASTPTQSTTHPTNNTVPQRVPLVHYGTQNLSGQIIVDSISSRPMNGTTTTNSNWISSVINHRGGVAQQSSSPLVAGASFTGPRSLMSDQTLSWKTPTSSASSRKKVEPEPLWVEQVRLWARRFLVPSSQARIHVSTLRDEFLKYKRSAGGDDHIDYVELAKLFGFAKSHESRIFTLTVLSVVGTDAKRQQCVISGINQCGIVGWKVDFASQAISASNSATPATPADSLSG